MGCRHRANRSHHDDPVPTDVNASVYDIDWQDTAAQVATLHALGRHVICYVDVGSWENYRPDAKVVFDTEYTNDTSLTTFMNADCNANSGYYLIYKHVNLDAYIGTCGNVVQTSSVSGSVRALSVRPLSIR
jgi:hypothetical protein